MHTLLFRHIDRDIVVGQFETIDEVLAYKTWMNYASNYVSYIDFPNGLRKKIVCGNY